MNPADPYPAGCPVDQVIATGDLLARPPRSPDNAGENAALLRLARALRQSPHDVLQELTDSALALTGAHSSGISVLEGNGSDAVFRWRATAGSFERCVGDTLPRNFSPCGTVLDRQMALLMANPVRAFPYISQLHQPVCEVLLVPFARGDALVGTVWVVAHTVDKHFDREDLRLLGNLAQFASIAVQVLEEHQKQTEFLATLAHELRNPLVPIRHGLNLLQRDRAHAEEPRIFSMMNRQTSHLVRLIDDLMDVSRIANGKMELRRESVSINRVIADAMESSRAFMVAQGHALTLDMPAREVMLDGDPVRLAQVFSNLLINAAKYTPAGGRIDVSAQVENGDIVVTVRDNGLGIDIEDGARIFEMFSQVRISRERSQGGLGIGLSLSRTIAEMHGGSICVHSAGPGKGSAFIVRMPIVVSHESAGRDIAAAEAAPDDAAGLRILVVDDNEDNRESFALLLRMDGHRVDTAATGNAGLHKAVHDQPDIVVLDVGLPDIDGYEIATRLRAMPAFKGVLVAATGWGSPEDKQRAMAAGFDVHLTKPVMAEELNRIIDRTAAAQRISA